MIFVCLGTQIFQFNRLLQRIDDLVYNKIINDDIVAQIGYSDYVPRYYYYEHFMNKENFSVFQNKADLIITHGGTGAIISASKLGKNIIAVPRLAEFNEHVDNHQLQIVKLLEKEGYIRAVYDIEDLESVVQLSLKNPIDKIYQRESLIIDLITHFIERGVDK